MVFEEITTLFFYIFYSCFIFCIYLETYKNISCVMHHILLYLYMYFSYFCN